MESNPARKNPFEFNPSIEIEKQSEAVMLGIEKANKVFLYGGLSVPVTGLQKFILENLATKEITESIISFYGIDPNELKKRGKPNEEDMTRDLNRKMRSKFYTFFLMNLLGMSAENKRHIFSGRYYMAKDFTDYAMDKVAEFELKRKQYFLANPDADPEISRYLKTIGEDGISPLEIFYNDRIPLYYIVQSTATRHINHLDLKQALKEVAFGLSKDKSISDFASARRKPEEIRSFLVNSRTSQILNPKVVKLIKERRGWL